MATFRGKAAVQNFVGGGGTDTVNYLTNGTSGVTVDVSGGGTRGIAQDDTYTSIERFFLTNVGTEVDYFIGSSANEEVRGYAGPNVLLGGGGNDILRGGDDRNVLNGGTGRDNSFGGAGMDRFDVAAGDAVAGEIYSAGGGIDTMRFIAGGTGSTIDLSAVSLISIERFEFETDVTVTVDSFDLESIEVFGTSAGTGEMIEVAGWSTTDATVDMNAAFDMIDNGVDAVSWNYGDDTGSVTLTETVRDGTTGETAYVETFVNDGAVDTNVATEQTFYDQFQGVYRTIVTADSGLQTISEFDTATGTVLERLIFDLSDDGNLQNYQYRFFSYDAAGELENRITLFDSGLEREDAYSDGDRTATTFTDTNDSLTYNTIEEFYAQDENDVEYMTSRVTTNDASETFAIVQEIFNADGSVERQVRETQAGVGSTLGSDADQTFVATENNEAILGRGGVDTFVFSGNVGRTTLNSFDENDEDLLDLTAYGIDSRSALDMAGAVSTVGGVVEIDVSLIGGSGTIRLADIVESDLGDNDFVFL